MNHVLASEFADQKISALTAEAAAVRLARSTRSIRTAPQRKRESLLLAALRSSLRR